MENDNKYFKDKLEGFEQRPSLGVWKNLDDKLAAKAQKGRIVFFLRVAAAVLLLLVSVFFFFRNDFNEGKVLSNKNLKESKAQDQLAQQGFINDENKGLKEENRKSSNQKEETEILESTDLKEDKIEKAIKNSKKNVVKTRKEIETPKRDLEDFVEPLLPSKVQLASDDIKKKDSSSESIIDRPEFDNQLLAQIEENPIQMESETRSTEIAPVNSSRSVTIILKPVAFESSESEIEKDEKSTYEKIKETMQIDLYKQKFRIGGISE